MVWDVGWFLEWFEGFFGMWLVLVLGMEWSGVSFEGRGRCFEDGLRFSRGLFSFSFVILTWVRGI